MLAFLPSQLLLGNTSTFSSIPKGRALRALNSFLRRRTWLISPLEGGTLASKFHNQGTTHAAVCTEIVTLVGMPELDGNCAGTAGNVVIDKEVTKLGLLYPE